MNWILEKANPWLHDLVSYIPGKPIEDVARELGLEPSQIVKLASNENPIGPSPLAVQAMQEGDAILVVLAAANRDPSVNLHPDRFDLFRKDRKLFTFGAGVHACPGERLATMIAQAGIEQLLRTGIELERFAAARAYRPSVNARIPFGEASTVSVRR